MSAPKERPIIFSGPMIRAILEGRKNQTRRLATSPLTKTQPGDRLWVRETWAHDAPDLDALRRGIYSDGMFYGPYFYADGRWEDNRTLRKRPAIHMPRFASRITLRVTDVRIERLQDISREDALAEGVDGGCGPGYDFAQHAFMMLWSGLHSSGAWAANPEVVAISFERVDGGVSRRRTSGGSR